jgi:hypothetical protein
MTGAPAANQTQQKPAGSSSSSSRNSSDALRNSFLQQVAQGTPASTPVVALQEHLQSRLAAQMQDDNTDSTYSADMVLQQYSPGKAGTKADKETSSWEALMAGLQRIPELVRQQLLKHPWLVESVPLSLVAVGS